MPIYEYRCLDCKNDFEAILWNSSDQESVRCPKCDGKEVVRVLSLFSKSCGSGSGSQLKPNCGPGLKSFS